MTEIYWNPNEMQDYVKEDLLSGSVDGWSVVSSRTVGQSIPPFEAKQFIEVELIVTDRVTYWRGRYLKTYNKYKAVKNHFSFAVFEEVLPFVEEVATFKPAQEIRDKDSRVEYLPKASDVFTAININRFTDGPTPVVADEPLFLRVTTGEEEPGSINAIAYTAPTHTFKMSRTVFSKDENSARSLVEAVQGRLMAERIITANIGDWSNDGHGKHESVKLKLVGDDVSDEALNASLTARTKEFGFSIFECFVDYEECQLTDAQERVLVALLTDRPESDDRFSFPIETDEGEKWYNYLELFEIYLGVKILNVEDEDDVLFGGYDTILKSPEQNVSTSFGYGFFY